MAPEFFVKHHVRRPAACPAAGTFPGLLRLLVVLCIFLLLPERAMAHAVYIFAWVDGPRLCTQSYFSKSSRVRGGEIGMADREGTVLDSGLSDDEGLLCFAPPRQARDLVFTVKAGQGHRGEYLLPAAEVGQAIAARQRKGRGDGSSAAQAGASAADNATQPVSSPGPAVFPSPAAPSSPAASAGSAVSGEQALSPAAREEVLDMIRQEISALRRTLAEQNNNASPGIRDIFGGLGWIFGLAAVGALYYNRGKRN